jgi:hypothetical protein
MATVKQAYGSLDQAITITLNSLTNGSGSYGAGQSSAYVDNSVNLYLDALVQVQIKTSASALANDQAVYVYAYGSSFGTTSGDFTDGITGSDGAFTGTNPPNARLLGVINAVATSTTYTGGPWAASLAFGGTLPEYWGIYVVNYTGQALNSSGNSAWYQGVQATVA